MQLALGKRVRKINFQNLFARFALSVGDNAYESGSQANYGDLYQTGPNISAVFGPDYWAKVGASLPLFTAVGNHGGWLRHWTRSGLSDVQEAPVG